MKALVTGGAGFIGSTLAAELCSRGHDVIVLDNLMAGARDRVPEGATFLEADLRDLEAIRPAFTGVEVVFHQAALGGVPRSVEDPRLATDCNLMGTLHVLMAAQQAGVRRVVYASSSSIYGGGEAVQREDQPPRPQSPYAASKLASEQYCQVWTRLHDLGTVALRYFNVFGPGQSAESRYAAVFPSFVKALVEGRAPDLHWDGEQLRDFTFVDDVVAANLAAAEPERKIDGEVINIGGGGPKSINEVLRAVSDAVGTWIEPNSHPQRAGDIRSSHADITKASELLGWMPKADWKDAVERTVGWFKSRA